MPIMTKCWNKIIKLREKISEFDFSVPRGL
jgi:hypothetical protein